MAKTKKTYHPGRSPDNAKAIASGDLGVLVDYLRDLASIALRPRDAEERKTLLLERSMAALEYGEALAEYLRCKSRGRPRNVFTIIDATRAIEAANEYKRLEGTLPPERLKRKIQSRYGISRAVLRGALNGTLPDIEWPGIPSSDK